MTEKDTYGRKITENFDQAAHSPEIVLAWYNKHGLKYHDVMRVVDNKAVIVTNFGKGKYLVIPDHELPDPPTIPDNHFDLLEQLI